MELDVSPIWGWGPIVLFGGGVLLKIELDVSPIWGWDPIEDSTIGIGCTVSPV